MAEAVNDADPTTAISTAVTFLGEVPKEIYNEARLTRYLKKQGLTHEQVKEAFRIHRVKAMRRSRQNSKSNIMSDESKSQISRSSDQGGTKRPERRMASTNKNKSRKIKMAKSNSSYLRSEVQADGEKLIKEFLEHEEGYCNVLRCLNDEYLQALTWHAERGTIKLRLKEVQKLFSRIPKLCIFHTSFYKELIVGTNIGRLFIRDWGYFKTYAEYVKEAASIIQLLRNHIFDDRLQMILGNIRRRSQLRSNDFTALLLAPIDRILDYWTLLDKLHQWADRTKPEEYQLFAKAEQRIGKIAKYVDCYRHSIINMSEMNRAQLFLGHQYSVIVPGRSILRRGSMTRRTTGWKARNKHYYFFLFNDVLLWTTKAGVLRNIVKLIRCKLLPSDAKMEQNKKFKIVINQWTKEMKLLLLECNTERQKETWYNSLDNAIKSANEPITQLEAVDKFDSLIYSDSDEDKPDKKDRRTEDERFQHGGMLGRENSSSDNSSKISNLIQPPYGAFHGRQSSQNFIQQKLEVFKPMEDDESPCSESDNYGFDKFWENPSPSTSPMSPHRTSSRGIFTGSFHDGEHFIERKTEIGHHNDEEANNPVSLVINRMSESLTNRSVSNEDIYLKRSSFTVRLSDRSLTSDPDFMISLSHVENGVYIQ